jgi:hypothetical protein
VIPPTSPLQLEPTAPSPPARREAYVAATPQVASPVTPATQRPRGRLGVSPARRTATRSRSRTFGVSHSSDRNPPASNASCNAMRRVQQLAHGRLVVLVRSRVACVRPSPVGRAHGPIGFPGAGGISGPVCVRPSPRHFSLLSWVLASCARPSSRETLLCCFGTGAVRAALFVVVDGGAGMAPRAFLDAFVLTFVLRRLVSAAPRTVRVPGAGTKTVWPPVAH